MESVSATVTSGVNNAMVSNAIRWFSGELPAQASAATRTATPLGHAAIGGGEHGGKHTTVGGDPAHGDLLGA